MPQERCFRGSWGGDAQDGHPRVGLGCWGLGTARLLPGTAVAAGTEVLGHGFDGPCGQRGAHGQARAQWDIPDTVCWRLNSLSQLPPGCPRARWGSGGRVPLSSCQDHHPQHPTVLISHGIGQVFSNAQNILLATQTPSTSPQNQQLLQGGFAKGKNLPTVGSHKPEPPAPQHACAMPKSHLGHQPGNRERVRDPSAALWLFYESRSDSQTLQTPMSAAATEV